MSNKNQGQQQGKPQKTAIRFTREADFPQWYQEVIKEADMAENSGVRGCMVIKPWGFGIWENLQRRLDKRIRETGHENCYFPLFIPIVFVLALYFMVKPDTNRVHYFARHPLVMVC